MILSKGITVKESGPLLLFFNIYRKEFHQKADFAE